MGNARRSVLAVLLLALACSERSSSEALGPHRLRFPQGAFLAHALGGIDGHTCTNSVETARTRHVPVVTMSTRRFNPDLVKRLAALAFEAYILRAKIRRA